MLTFSICAVCLNLLTFVQVAEPYFMITANLEDLKNIAKRYLAETTVDKIAEYISKFRLRDISEENEQTFSGETDIDDASRVNDRPDDNQLTDEETIRKETPKKQKYHNQGRAPVKNVGRMGPSPPKNNIKYKLTTQKRRYEEFDQYENTNYERRDVLATSGHIRLSAVRGFNRKTQRQ